MNKDSKKPNPKSSDRVEFGIEFGDINASKLYEIPFANQDKARKKKNDEC